MCKSGEVWTPISIAGDNLAIEHSRFGWELVQQMRDEEKGSVKSCPLRL